MNYHKTFNIRRTIAGPGKKILDHSGVVGALPVSTVQLHLNYVNSRLNNDPNGLDKGNYMTRQETFGIWCDLYEKFDGK